MTNRLPASDRGEERMAQQHVQEISGEGHPLNSFGVVPFQVPGGNMQPHMSALYRMAIEQATRKVARDSRKN